MLAARQRLPASGHAQSCCATAECPLRAPEQALAGNSDALQTLNATAPMQHRPGCISAFVAPAPSPRSLCASICQHPGVSAFTSCCTAPPPHQASRSKKGEGCCVVVGLPFWGFCGETSHAPRARQKSQAGDAAATQFECSFQRPAPNDLACALVSTVQRAPSGKHGAPCGQGRRMRRAAWRAGLRARPCFPAPASGAVLLRSAAEAQNTSKRRMRGMRASSWPAGYDGMNNMLPLPDSSQL